MSPLPTSTLRPSHGPVSLPPAPQAAPVQPAPVQPAPEPAPQKKRTRKAKAKTNGKEVTAVKAETKAKVKRTRVKANTNADTARASVLRRNYRENWRMAEAAFARGEANVGQAYLDFALTIAADIAAVAK